MFLIRVGPAGTSRYSPSCFLRPFARAAGAEAGTATFSILVVIACLVLSSGVWKECEAGIVRSLLPC